MAFWSRWKVLPSRCLPLSERPSCGFWIVEILNRGFIRLKCPDSQVERVLPEVAIRQYVLPPPSDLVGLLVARGEALSALGRILIDSIFRGIQSRNALGNLNCGVVSHRGSSIRWVRVGRQVSRCTRGCESPEDTSREGRGCVAT
jgi:hypothetical protein